MGAASGGVGQRVRWQGPVQRGWLTPAYRAAIAGGLRRPPKVHDLVELRPGDEGTIVRRVASTKVGVQYTVQFDSGYELDLVLPSALVDTTVSAGT